MWSLRKESVDIAVEMKWGEINRNGNLLKKLLIPCNY